MSPPALFGSFRVGLLEAGVRLHREPLCGSLRLVAASCGVWRPVAARCGQLRHVAARCG